MSKKYATEFTEKSLWQKVAHGAKTVCREVIEKALTMYYTTMDKDIPVWAKTVLVGDLGYFISPFAATPDAIPIARCTEVGAFGLVAAHIKPEYKDLASGFTRSRSKTDRNKNGLNQVTYVSH